jgi:hypothetical protein
MIHLMTQKAIMNTPSIAIGNIAGKLTFDTYRLSLSDNFKSDIAVVPT